MDLAGVFRTGTRFDGALLCGNESPRTDASAAIGPWSYLLGAIEDAVTTLVKLRTIHHAAGFVKVPCVSASV